MPYKTPPCFVPSDQKYCFKCNSLHPLSDFYFRYSGAGSKVYVSHCKSCRNAATRKNYALKREHYIQQRRDNYTRKKAARLAEGTS
jgi:hypothetical protein